MIKRAKNVLPSRSFAHPFDRNLQRDKNRHGLNRSSNAIGGYYSMGWYETFADHLTGEIFQVHCHDGVNGGSGSYLDYVDMWISSMHRNLRAQYERGYSSRAKEIIISTEEWCIMRLRSIPDWIDTPVDDSDGQFDQDVFCGQIGTYKKIPVIVDPMQPSPLPSVPTEAPLMIHPSAGLKNDSSPLTYTLVEKWTAQSK